MRKLVLVLVAVFFSASFALLSPDLEEQLSSAKADELIRVDIALNNQFDSQLLRDLVDGMPKRQKQAEVGRILRAFNAGEQADLLSYLESKEAEGRVQGVLSLWLVNMVYCEATPEVIRAIEKRGDVHYVDTDVKYVPGLLPAIAEPDVTDSAGDEIDWGVQKINAPAVWALGYTGQGIVVGDIDTGCNYNHVDLADHMWTDPNYPHHGWDFLSNDDDPMDTSGHGTHTCGTVASDGTAGSQCGVAPDAQIMSCRVRTVADSIAETQCWAAMQFVVSPPLSPANGGDIITMSLGWRNSWHPQRKLWRDGCNNVGAAGVIMIVAAGNERSSAVPYSCRTPGDVPPPWWNPQNIGTGSLSNVISIGATDANDNYASFSSKGPVEWGTVVGYADYVHPPGLTRPDVAAPGVNIKSCRHNSNNTYTTMSGTSMATPTTAGCAALMLSKNSNLSPAVVDSILEITALDLGPSGKDMDYGAGRIDALAAVNHITGSGGPMLHMQSMTVIDSPPGGNNNGRVDPGETADLEMTLRNSGGAACNNTVGTLHSGDARLVVTDPNGTWGNIPSGGTATNSSDRFEVQAGSGIPPGTAIPCTLHVTGDSADYAKTFVFNLAVGEPPMPGALLMDHDTGYCRLTVSCFGPIGYDLPPADAGSGFQYPKGAASALFYSSFAIGQSPSYVADRHFSNPASGAPNTDLEIVDSLRPYVDPAADQVFRGTFDDDGHPSPLGIEVTQYSYQCADPGYDDFVAIQYVIKNTSGSTINGLYAGVFADFDIGTSNTNTCTSDETRRFTYMRQASSANPTVGVKILSPSSFANLAAVDHARYVYPDSCMTDGQKFRFLNGTIVQRNSNRNYDWSVLVSVGPFNLGPRSAHPVWFAFVGGSSESNALVNADSAQSWFDNNVGILESPGGDRVRARLVSVRPNPFTGQTRIRYQVGKPGRVRIDALDITGRAVANIFDQVVGAGPAEFVWQPDKLARGVYFLRVQSPDAVMTERVVLGR